MIIVCLLVDRGGSRLLSRNPPETASSGTFEPLTQRRPQIGNTLRQNVPLNGRISPADHVAVGRRDQPDVDLDWLLAPTDRFRHPGGRNSFTWASSGSSPPHRGTACRHQPPGTCRCADRAVTTLRGRKGCSQRFSGMAQPRDERLAGPIAFALNGTGDQLLADTRFPFDEHWNIGTGCAPAERDHSLHCLAGNEIVEGQRPFALPSEPRDLAAQRAQLERSVYRDFESFRASLRR